MNSVLLGDKIFLSWVWKEWSNPLFWPSGELSNHEREGKHLKLSFLVFCLYIPICTTGDPSRNNPVSGNQVQLRAGRFTGSTPEDGFGCHRKLAVNIQMSIICPACQISKWKEEMKQTVLYLHLNLTLCSSPNRRWGGEEGRDSQSCISSGLKAAVLLSHPGRYAFH